VAGLVLRNVFLARREDIAHFFAAAARTQVPGWSALQAQAEAARCEVVDWLADLFANGTVDAQREAAAIWSQAEQRLAGSPDQPTPDAAALDALVDRYRIQSHYLRHACWIAAPGLLERCKQVPAVPLLLLQGTEDAICPPEGAMALARALGPRATLRLVQGAGHDPAHPAMAQAMRQALDAMRGEFP
jgi:proline iminopeptidase